MSTLMTIRLEDEVKDRLDVLAEAADRSWSFLAAEVARVFIENNEWQMSEIQAALKEADAGDFASGKELAVLARLVLFCQRRHRLPSRGDAVCGFQSCWRRAGEKPISALLLNQDRATAVRASSAAPASVSIDQHFSINASA